MFLWIDSSRGSSKYSSVNKNRGGNSTMANRENKHSQNVSGSFYCTAPDDPDGCTACRICYDTAPEFFMSDAEGNAYVFNQPKNEEEIALCQEQLDICPSQSIGNDG